MRPAPPRSCVRGKEPSSESPNPTGVEEIRRDAPFAVWLAFLDDLKLAREQNVEVDREQLRANRAFVRVEWLVGYPNAVEFHSDEHVNGAGVPECVAGDR